MLNLNTPARRARALPQSNDELAATWLHGVVRCIDAVADGAPSAEERFDYIANGSRMATIIDVGDVDGQRLVTVRFTARPLEAAAGLVAFWLATYLHLEVSVWSYGMRLSLPPRHEFERLVLPREPKAIEPDDTLDAHAERHLADVVGRMLNQHREQPRDAGYGQQANPSWKDAVYGVCGINARVYRTYQTVDGLDGEIGGLSLRMTAANHESPNDALEAMVDIAAFARQHNLVFVRKDGQGYWYFLFANPHPTA